MPLVKRGDIWHGYVTVNGVRSRQRTTGCRDEKAALAVLAEWERELADPAYASSKSATVDQACNAVLKLYGELARIGKKSKATEDYYSDKLGTVARVLTPKLPLSALRQPGGALVLDNYVTTRRTEGAVEHTIAKELSALKRVLRYAKRAGWWSGDADAIFPPSFSTEYDPRDRSLTGIGQDDDELAALLFMVPTGDAAAQIAFAVATGAELGCIQRAQRNDIAEDGRFVLLRGTKRELRWRTVPLVTDLQQRLMAFVLRNAAGEGPFLFKHTESLRNALRKKCIEMDIPHVCTNDLRRTFAVHMRESGFPLELIAPMMGHSDTRMLERVYGRLNPEQLRDRLVMALNAIAVCSTGVENGPGSGRMAPDGNRATPRKLAPRAGFEPATHGLTVPVLISDYTVIPACSRFIEASM